MGFRALRVINDDRVVAGAGFGTHGHRDMEIISYVLDGALAHRDSLGSGSTLRPGDVQRMSAGTGIRHSEYNASASEPVHFLQIWVLPERAGLSPGYEERHFETSANERPLSLVANPTGQDGALKIHQDVRLYALKARPAQTIEHSLPRDRYGWLQVARGEVELNGHRLHAGDGAAIVEETALRITATSDCEALLFDLA